MKTTTALAVTKNETHYTVYVQHGALTYVAHVAKGRVLRCRRASGVRGERPAPVAAAALAAVG